MSVEHDVIWKQYDLEKAKWETEATKLKKRIADLESMLQKTEDGVTPLDGESVYRVDPKYGNIEETVFTVVSSPNLEGWHSTEKQAMKGGAE